MWWITCGLSPRHPIVILAAVNLCLMMLFYYLEAMVVHGPPGRLPYVIQVLAVPFASWSPICIYAYAEEISRGLFGWPPVSRLPDEGRPRGGWVRVAAYGAAIFETVIFSGAVYESLGRIGWL